jgi:hypothetical protein
MVLRERVLIEVPPEGPAGWLAIELPAPGNGETRGLIPLKADGKYRF